MNIMKYIRLLTVVCLSCSLYGVADAAQPIKVLDRSASKAPVWLDRTQEEYVITSAIADDWMRLVISVSTMSGRRLSSQLLKMYSLGQRVELHRVPEIAVLPILRTSLPLY